MELTNWYIKCTEENQEILSDYFHSIGDKYEGYVKTWVLKPNCHYVYPQIDNGWGYENIDVKSKDKEYEEITFEEFKKYILKQEIESSNILTTCL